MRIFRSQLKEKLKQIESSLAEREVQLMSENLRQEYDRQLNNIRNLRALYEERARVSAAERENLNRQLDTKRAELESEIEKWVKGNSTKLPTKRIKSLLQKTRPSGKIFRLYTLHTYGLCVYHVDFSFSLEFCSQLILESHASNKQMMRPNCDSPITLEMVIAGRDALPHIKFCKNCDMTELDVFFLLFYFFSF